MGLEDDSDVFLVDIGCEYIDREAALNKKFGGMMGALIMISREQDLRRSSVGLGLAEDMFANLKREFEKVDNFYLDNDIGRYFSDTIPGHSWLRRGFEDLGKTMDALRLKADSFEDYRL